MELPYQDVVYSTPDGDLWIGHRRYGAFHFDGQNWTGYNVKDGLADNRIRALLQTADGGVWVGTNKGVSRFDGHTWTTNVLHPDVPSVDMRGLKQSRDGALWINVSGSRTIRYKPDTDAPEVEITLSLTEVSQPGNTTLAWKGSDPWRDTPTGEVQYAWKLDNGPWSAFSPEKSVILQTLPSGKHTFSVKARDRDFNEDPTPAVLTFTVVPPVWQEPWFIGMVIVSLSSISVQTARVIRRDRRLQISNAALSDANKELFEANREIQEQTERKSAFLASMAHDLRTPMNAVMGFTNVVLRRGAERLSERHRDNLNKVIQASDHLLAMINDLMDLSKIEAGRMDVNPETFDVKALIATCCATVSPLVSEKPDVKLEYGISDDIGEANTDQARLRRMIINLLSNAIKFTDTGSVTINAARSGDQLAIAVTDTGKGIPADEIDTIFDEYRQVKGSDKEQKGTGLGLSITKKFAELMGGSIRVESVIGKGSTFTIRTPIIYEES